MKISLVILMLVFSVKVLSATDDYWSVPDWGENASIKVGESRANIYQLDDKTLKKWNRNGRLHALRYPVSVSGIFIPWKPLKKVLGNPKMFKEILHKNGFNLEDSEIDSSGIPFTNMSSFFDWIGLSPYPKNEGVGVFFVPRP